MKNQNNLMWQYLLRYRAMCIGVICALVCTSSCVLAIAHLIQRFIDYGVAQRDVPALKHYTLLVILAAISLGIATCLRFFLVTWMAEKIANDIRRDIYKKSLYLSMKEYEIISPGSIVSMIISDTELILSIISRGISIAMRNVLMLTGGIVMMCVASWKLTLCIILVIPIIIAPVVFCRRSLKDHSATGRRTIAKLSDIVNESVHAIKIVLSYNRQNYFIEQFKKTSALVMASSHKRIKIKGALILLIISLAFSGISLILFEGGLMVIGGTLSAGQLSSFLFVSVLCAGAVSALSDAMGDIAQLKGAFARIEDFLLTKSDVVKPSAASLDISGKKIIEFKSVKFCYPSKPSAQVLKNMSFDIEKGKITAIVGRSGVGKTTIFEILQKFYNISSGDVFFCGKSLQLIDTYALRNVMAVVPQECVIFSGTIYQNILYAKPSASKADVLHAAKIAYVNEFSDNMEHGINTDIGQSGLRLSGGQRQRISIARAILKNPQILLLDEATSSLDGVSEKLVQRAITKLMQHRTTIVIAHRLSTISNADKILVLDGGTLCQSGKHSDLLKNKGGVYNNLISTLEAK